MDLKLVGIFINNSTFTNKQLSEVLGHLSQQEVEGLLTQNVPADLVSDFLEPMKVGIANHITKKLFPKFWDNFEFNKNFLR